MLEHASHVPAVEEGAARRRVRQAAVVCATALLTSLAAPATAHAALDDRVAVQALFQIKPPLIQTLQADGTQKRDITSRVVNHVTDTEWSPDGSELVALAQGYDEERDQGVMDLRVFAQDGSAERVLATDVALGADDPVTWTNDSSHVAYLAGTENDTRLTLVRRDGEARAVLDTGRRDMQQLQWSPGGGLVTFTSSTGDGAVGLFAVNPDGSGLRQLADQAGTPDLPQPLSWSPDGDRFAYARNPQYAETVRVVSRDGTVVRDLGEGRDPRWSPDGESVAMLRTGTVIFSDPDTGEQREIEPQVPPDTGIRRLRNWSPDSQHLLVTLAFANPNNVSVRPFVLDVRTGEVREIDTEADDEKFGGEGVFAPLPTTPPATRGTATACSGAPSAGFTDTTGNSFAAQIDCIAWYDVARGTTATTYSPGAPVTRAQMALFLTRVTEQAGAELDTSDAGFEDLDQLTQEARDAVNAVANLGVAQGASPNRFAPSQHVSRGQMASFLARLHLAISGEELGPRVHCFADVSASVHRAAAEKLCGAGVASGTSRGVYNPGAAVTRAQMAGFLARLLDIEVEVGIVERPAQQ
jgi:Tol biopolymer transport system component